MKLTVNPELQKKQGKLVSGVQLKEMDFFDTEDKKKKFCQMMEGMSDEIFESTQKNLGNFLIAKDQKTADSIEEVVFKKHIPSLKKTYLEGVWDHHDPTKPLVTITDYNHMFTALTYATLNYVEHHQCVKIKDFMHSTAKEVTLTIDEVVANNVDPSLGGTFNRGLLVSAVMCRATDSPNWMEEWRNFLHTLGPKGHKQTLKETKESLNTLEPVLKYQKLSVLGASKMVDVTVTVERVTDKLKHVPDINDPIRVRRYRVTAAVPYPAVMLSDVEQAVGDRLAGLLTRCGRVIYHDILFQLSSHDVPVKETSVDHIDLNLVVDKDGVKLEEASKVGTNQPVPCSPPHYVGVGPTYPKTLKNPKVQMLLDKQLEKFVGQKNTPATQHEIKQTLAAQHEIKQTLAAYAEADAKAMTDLAYAFAKQEVDDSGIQKFHPNFLKALEIPPEMLGYPPTKVD